MSERSIEEFSYLRDSYVIKLIEDAIRGERERCAKIAESFFCVEEEACDTRDTIAKAIRGS